MLYTENTDDSTSLTIFENIIDTYDDSDDEDEPKIIEIVQDIPRNTSDEPKIIEIIEDTSINTNDTPEKINDIYVNSRSKVNIDKDVSDYAHLIEKAHMLNKRYDSNLKYKNILLEEGNVLIDRINTLKNKSKKRIEKSKAILKEYDVVNVNINVIIEKS